MHAFAWGQIGLKPREYYLLTPYEYDRICEGFLQREGIREEPIRMAAFLIWNLQVESKYRLKHPKELWTIKAIDKDEPQKIETEQQQEMNYKEFQRLKEKYK